MVQFDVLIYSLLIFGLSVWISLCHIGDYLSEFACEEYDAVEPSYDYIVVGAGSAGSIVALRLAESKKDTVLLIEAGTDPTFALNIPALGQLLKKSRYDWQYQTEPQDGACLGLKDKRSNWPMGRVVGGTGMLNNMLYVRGHRLDYDGWSAAGNPTWGYNEDARFYFKQSEAQMGSYKGDSVYHGVNGMLPVADLPQRTELSDAVLAAGAELGHAIGDLNAGTLAGFTLPQVNVVNGSRFSASRLIRGAVGRGGQAPNVRLLTQAVVEKVLFNANMEAVGVLYRRFGKTKRVANRKTVILSAGTIGSPKILMLSGVGPRSHLAGLGIKVRRDLPVGQNLQDHVTTGLDLVLLNKTMPMSMGNLLLPSAAFNYFWNGEGLWVHPGCEAVGLVHSRLSDPAADPPDLQLMVVPAGVSADGGVQIRWAMGISDQIWSEYFQPLCGRPAVSLLPVLLHPRSRGHVRLRSRDPQDMPVVDPRYLTDDYDVDVLYEGIKLVKSLIATRAMQSLGAELYTRPLPGCEGHQFDSEEYWRCYIRHLTMTAYHPVGTCKMGPRSDPTAVVNRFLRVHGTYRLRVMDASVMPTMPSGNPNAAVVMIAEKGAANLRAYWRHFAAKPLKPVDACIKMDVFLPRAEFQQ